MNDQLPHNNNIIIDSGGGSDRDQVTHLQFENSPSVSPLFLYHAEDRHHGHQQLNPPSRDIRHDRPHQHHQYECLSSLILQHQSTCSFGIDGDNGNHGNHDDDKSWNHSDNDSNTSSNNNTALPNDGNGNGKSGFSFASLSLSDSPRDIMVGMVGILVVGIILGLLFSSSSSSSSSIKNSTWSTLSNILGFSYFVSWTCSFYPQIITNWYSPTEAKSGVSLDFCVWNIVGFVCYAIYTTCFRFSNVVRMEYAHRFGGGENGNIINTTIVFYYDGHDVSDGFENGTDLYGSDDDNVDDVLVVPQVQINDVAFAWHALLLATITFVQLAWLNVGGVGSSVCVMKHSADRSQSREWLDEQHVEVEEGDESIMDDRGQIQNTRPTGPCIDDTTYHKESLLDWTKRISSTTKLLMLLLLVVCLAGAIFVSCHVTVRVGGKPSRWEWIDYLYFLSFVKVGISIVKYIPQVLLNYRRKSTKGWQIWNIILDFSGGTLSIIQLIGDSIAEAEAQKLSHSSWTTGIVGNPAKFGLGMVSIFFDHYVLYRQSSSSSANWLRIHNDDSERPLLHGGDCYS